MIARGVPFSWCRRQSLRADRNAANRDCTAPVAGGSPPALPGGVGRRPLSAPLWGDLRPGGLQPGLDEGTVGAADRLSYLPKIPRTGLAPERVFRADGSRATR